MRQGDADVIVVGAGFTGLAAAEGLIDRGLSVILLEARSEVGGRVRSFVASDGTRRDAGGQFLCEDMPEIMALAADYGFEPVESRWKGQPKTIAATSSGDMRPQARAGYRANRLFTLMEKADPDDPALAGLSILDWLDRQDAPEAARRDFLAMVHGLWCRPAADIPIWYLLDSDRRNTANVSELQYFLKDSCAALADAMAARLRAHLHPATPASRIVREAGGVRVEAGHAAFSARHVLIAVPPVRACEIAQVPPLPPALQAALRAWRSGAVIKILVRYARRAWPASLSSGLSWQDASGLYAFDTSLSDDAAAFVVFIGGPLALDWRTKGTAWIGEEVTRRLGGVLGPEVGEPVEIVTHDWTDDRWSGGGYSDVIVEATARDAEAVLLAGAPGVSFASSELSPSFPSYIEGAIVAGRAAAERIAALLSGS